KSLCANVLKRDDDYASPGKPECDWDDDAARLSLVDELTRDAHAVLQILDDKRTPHHRFDGLETLALFDPWTLVRPSHDPFSTVTSRKHPFF
ncbi:MAG: hypothetical protein GY822_06770, partial [Deltaproteobacteria bacterium]|nr:hypothetical protein [Deltaproteobacteria bacterium]